MRELQMIAIEKKGEIIGITEVSPTYIKEVLSKQHFTLDGSDLYTNIEEEEGVAMYITKHLTLRSHEIKTDAVFKESIWIQLNLRKSTKIMLECIYRSPTSSPVTYDKLHKLLAVSNSRGPSQVIVLGDFNHPEIYWNTKTTEKGVYHRSRLFLDAVRDAYFIQHMYASSIFRRGQNPLILDLLLPKAEPCFLYHKGDYKKMNQNLLEMDWETDLNGLTAEDAWTFSPQY
ncbi:hypothetical protein LSH36_22g03030 [Paralvinella palmiformis]|uniref:Endonuclease/exonuclease/phosphatase domain-containing protein n=1 Tax=Paralvinella palmiformis TaxID=53620 RepID=A0AAD9KB97_9ANNE|nr:hypothetical protein LSH36_22g03030 [Paralvinella palmiformis]